MHSCSRQSRRLPSTTITTVLSDGRHVSELTRADTLIFDDPPAVAPARPILRLAHDSADDSVDVGPMSAACRPTPCAEAASNAEWSLPAQAMMTVEQVGEMAVVHIECPAVRERQAAALADQLFLVAEQSRGRIMLDLKKVTAFSCAWINVLLDVSKRCRARGGGLVLIGLCSPAAHTLRQLGLERQFTIAA